MVTVSRVRILLDPPHDIFNVEISSNGGAWRHTVGSEGELMQFLRGVEAGVAMRHGHLSCGQIPTSPSMELRPKSR
jgi:hypothetical protein